MAFLSFSELQSDLREKPWTWSSYNYWNTLSASVFLHSQGPKNFLVAIEDLPESHVAPPSWILERPGSFRSRWRAISCPLSPTPSSRVWSPGRNPLGWTPDLGGKHTRHRRRRHHSPPFDRAPAGSHNVHPSKSRWLLSCWSQACCGWCSRTHLSMASRPLRDASLAMDRESLGLSRRSWLSQRPSTSLAS